MKKIWRLPSLILLVAGAVAITSTGAVANTVDRTDIDPIVAINAVAPHVFQNGTDHAKVTREGATLVSSAGTSIHIPKEATQGITLTNQGDSLTIGLPQANKSETRQASNGSAYYRNSAASSVVPVLRDDGSVQIISVSETAASPSEFSYVLQPPDGTKILPGIDGGYVLQDAAGNLTGLINAPWAIDASGVKVPTHYELVGNMLTQHIDFSAPGIEFPVVADPTIYYFWWGYGVKYTKSETARVANAANNNSYYTYLCGVIPSYPIIALCASLAFVMYAQYFSAFTQAKNAGKCVQVNYPFAGAPVPSWAYVVNC